jgi:hypothetical protein
VSTAGVAKCNNIAHLHVCWERTVTVFVPQSILAEYLRFSANVARVSFFHFLLLVLLLFLPLLVLRVVRDARECHIAFKFRRCGTVHVSRIPRPLWQFSSYVTTLRGGEVYKISRLLRKKSIFVLLRYK